jgi:hypothetical protein
MLEDFLSDGPTGFTDMLLCDKEDMDNQSFCAFFVLLVNLIDSDVPRRPLSEFQYTFNKLSQNARSCQVEHTKNFPDREGIRDDV